MHASSFDLLWAGGLILVYVLALGALVGVASWSTRRIVARARGSLEDSEGVRTSWIGQSSTVLGSRGGRRCAIEHAGIRFTLAVETAWKGTLHLHRAGWFTELGALVGAVQKVTLEKGTIYLGKGCSGETESRLRRAGIGHFVSELFTELGADHLAIRRGSLCAHSFWGRRRLARPEAVERAFDGLFKIARRLERFDR